MFGDEVREINESHRRAQTRMTGGASEISIAGTAQRDDERQARRLKPVHELRQRPPIMVGLVRRPVRQISGGEIGTAVQDLLHAT